MPSASAYHIGTPGQKWGSAEVAQWRSERTKSRSYMDDVVSALDPLRSSFEVVEYGKLDYDAGAIDHPLFAVKTKDWDHKRPSVLVTGGVHGYETSGVHGALRFLSGGEALNYAAKGLNILVAPCVSPWGYEHIQRWTSEAVDPNRSFASRTDPHACGSQESAALVRLLNSCGVETWACHVDLHETTDTDETEFRVAKAARDGLTSEPGTIPDGFYLCGDEKNPKLEFQRAVITGVRKVTHIAPADPDGTIIGSKVVDEGVILYDYTALGLCGGVTNARFTTTTEVYPDSPKATDELCNL
eukprot:CAMPEP_0118636698 /NCGR_PEP_ID=MMETSP0785-20121206/2763_1 /TAXON_ID=91992 /ORGANISM="Bolidomonas pacifica, Strain CCMP 1866" /LENGTH=299 /DNA_ID=CAMNT_0006527845 /DNA_START=211 /DNA_END=1107 /DNA_ORIENTATION=-